MVDHSGWRVGVASAPIHHGEILQGVFPHQGRLTRGLVTLPCTVRTTRASFIPARGEELSVLPAWKTKAQRAARLAVDACTDPDEGPVGGHLELTGDVQLRRGFGSSTSDVLAAIWAVQDALCSELSPETVARIAVCAETASDSLMFKESSVLFAQREGAVIEDFGYRMPAVRVLGFGSRPENGGRGVDTLAFPPAQYGADDITAFAELHAMLREAIHTKDVVLLGAVATGSTELNQRHLPIPLLDDLRGVVRKTGALGIQTAHSGDIAGLLYDRDDPEADARIERGGHMLHDLGIHEQWIFTTGD